MRSLYDTVDGASLLSDDPFEMSYTRSVASQRGSGLTAPSVSSSEPRPTPFFPRDEASLRPRPTAFIPASSVHGDMGGRSSVGGGMNASLDDGEDSGTLTSGISRVLGSVGRGVIGALGASTSAMGDAQLGGVQRGGAQLGGVQRGGAQLGGVQRGGAQLGGVQRGGAQLGSMMGDVPRGDMQRGGTQLNGVQRSGAQLDDRTGLIPLGALSKDRIIVTPQGPANPARQPDSFRPFADRDLPADSFRPARTAPWRPRDAHPFPYASDYVSDYASDYASDFASDFDYHGPFVAESADIPRPKPPMVRKFPSVSSSSSHSARASAALPRLPSITVSSGDQPRTMSSFDPRTMTYHPTACLNKGSFRCPLYYNLQEPPAGNRFSIGNNSEYTEFVLAFCHDELARELQRRGVQVSGYYLNDHGFFLVTPQTASSVDLDAVLARIVDTQLKGLLKTQKLRIPLDDAHFLQYLLYVAEGFQGWGK